MKEKERIIVNHWIDVLANYVDPMALIGVLPKLFEYGNIAHEDVYRLQDQKHRAVNRAITTIIDSDLTLDDLIDAIRFSGNEWLATLIKGEVPESDVEIELAKAEDLKNIRYFLTAIGPHIKETIQAIDVAHHLHCQYVISTGEYERVESKAKSDGNSLAVIRLLSYLVRKTTNWLPSFVKILQKCKYDAELIHSLEKFLSKSSVSSSIGKQTEEVTVREEDRPDVEAKPHFSGAKIAAIFPHAGHQIPSNTERSIISIPAEAKGAELRTISDPFTSCLCETINKQIGILTRLSLAAGTECVAHPKSEDNPAVGLKDVTCLGSNIQACIEQIQIFNKALQIHIKKDVSEALNHLRQKKPQNWSHTSMVELELAELANTALDKLTECACQNGNWERVKNEIENAFSRDPSSRIMIIVEKEEHVHQMKDKLDRNETLTKMKISTVSLSGNKHMPEEKFTYERIIANLLNRVSKILVCTPKTNYRELDGIRWNLLICFDYAKGMLSKTIIYGRESQKYTSKEVNMCGGRSVTLVGKAIENAQDTLNERRDHYKDEITTQQNQILTRITAGTNTDRRNSLSPNSDQPNPDLSSSFEVQCVVCQTYICKGKDIVKLGTNHTCIDELFMDKVEKKKFEDKGTESKEGVHCKSCKSKLGIFATFKRVYFPQLHPGAVKFKYLGPNRYNDIIASKWAKVKIRFDEVEDDLVGRVYGIKAWS